MGFDTLEFTCLRYMAYNMKLARNKKYVNLHGKISGLVLFQIILRLLYSDRVEQLLDSVCQPSSDLRLVIRNLKTDGLNVMPLS